MKLRLVSPILAMVFLLASAAMADTVTGHQNPNIVLTVTYPATVTVGSTVNLTVTVTNHTGATVNVTVYNGSGVALGSKNFGAGTATKIISFTAPSTPQTMNLTAVAVNTANKSAKHSSVAFSIAVQ